MEALTKTWEKLAVRLQDISAWFSLACHVGQCDIWAPTLMQEVRRGKSVRTSCPLHSMRRVQGCSVASPCHAYMFCHCFAPSPLAMCSPSYKSEATAYHLAGRRFCCELSRLSDPPVNRLRLCLFQVNLNLRWVRYWACSPPSPRITRVTNAPILVRVASSCDFNFPHRSVLFCCECQCPRDKGTQLGPTASHGTSQLAPPATPASLHKPKI